MSFATYFFAAVCFAVTDAPPSLQSLRVREPCKKSTTRGTGRLSHRSQTDLRFQGLAGGEAWLRDGCGRRQISLALELLRDNAFGIDAAIIPVRDLAEAAVSRIALAHRAMHGAMLWMADLDQPWESWGQTLGSVTYSLNPIDQDRLSAVAFDRLVQRLARADIPVVFLDFLRLTQEPAYLLTRQRPYPPQDAPAAAAAAAHASPPRPTRSAPVTNSWPRRRPHASEGKCPRPIPIPAASTASR
jgi:hypothetical protein